MADLFDHAEDMDETPSEPVVISDAAPVAEQPVQKAANSNEEDMTALSCAKIRRLLYRITAAVSQPIRTQNLKTNLP